MVTEEDYGINYIEVSARHDNHRYHISRSDYQRILDLINLYHDSIYLLPDEETIEAFKLTKTGRHLGKVELQINEIIFL